MTAAGAAPVEEAGAAPPDAGITLAVAIKLAGGEQVEARFLGLGLALRHRAELAEDEVARAKLLCTVSAEFLTSLLLSQAALRRIGLAALHTLCQDEAGARKLAPSCASAVVVACAKPPAESVEDEAAGASWGEAEVMEALEVLRLMGDQLIVIADPELIGALRIAADEFVTLFAEGGSLADTYANVEMVGHVLALIQASGIAAESKVARALIVKASLRSDVWAGAAAPLAAALLTEQLEASPTERILSLDEVVGHCLGAGNPGRVSALQFAAMALKRHGLSFGFADGKPRLTLRLTPLLVLASGELRLGLEGHAPVENLCAACMLLEAAIIAMGVDAAAIEEAGELQNCADAMRNLHRAVGDVHAYCADESPGEDNINLPLIARVAAAWQLEDPRQFVNEFAASVDVFCRLDCESFKVLLPCIHEMPDWYLTKALTKVLEVLWAEISKESFDEGDTDSLETIHQCFFMLTEVCLDGGVYLPEATLPEPPTAGVRLTSGPSAVPAAAVDAAAFCAVKLPRPIAAGDVRNAGVRRLAGWSCALWQRGLAACRALGGTEGQRALWELGVLCGGLLVCVPEATVQLRGEADILCVRGIWHAVVDCLFADRPVQADAPVWRLAMRLAGFALDRHGRLAAALAARARGVAGCPAGAPHAPPGAEPDMTNDDDVWAGGDSAAAVLVRRFVAGHLSKGSPTESTWDWCEAEAAKHSSAMTVSCPPVDIATSDQPVQVHDCDTLAAMD